MLVKESDIDAVVISNIECEGLVDSTVDTKDGSGNFEESLQTSGVLSNGESPEQIENEKIENVAQSPEESEPDIELPSEGIREVPPTSDVMLGLKEVVGESRVNVKEEGEGGRLVKVEEVMEMVELGGVALECHQQLPVTIGELASHQSDPQQGGGEGGVEGEGEGADTQTATQEVIEDIGYGDVGHEDIGHGDVGHEDMGHGVPGDSPVTEVFEERREEEVEAGLGESLKYAVSKVADETSNNQAEDHGDNEQGQEEEEQYEEDEGVASDEPDGVLQDDGGEGTDGGARRIVKSIKKRLSVKKKPKKTASEDTPVSPIQGQLSLMYGIVSICSST